MGSGLYNFQCSAQIEDSYLILDFQVPEIAALVSSAPPSKVFFCEMTHSHVGRHDNPTLKSNVSMFLLVKVFVEWPSNIRVDLNDSVGVGRMQVRSELTNLIFTKTSNKAELTNLSLRKGHVLCGQQRRALFIL